MRNSSAIAQLIAASEAADDPLDRLACRRAAAWLRWCDGYGATLTEPEAARIGARGSLAGAAYRAAGGPASFGALSGAAGHAAASTAAFAQLAWITAGLCAAGALVAWRFIPPPDQSSGSSAAR